MGKVRPPDLMVILIAKAKREKKFIYLLREDNVDQWFNPEKLESLWDRGLVYFGDAAYWHLRDPQLFIDQAQKIVEGLNSQVIELKIDISEAVKFMTGKTKDQQDEDYFVTFPD